MAHPKRKISKTRRDKRRTHDNCTPRAFTECSNCGTTTLTHRVCTECGYYRGVQVMEVAATA
jgi:large subunit ribosomal protein L32